MLDGALVGAWRSLPPPTRLVPAWLAPLLAGGVLAGSWQGLLRWGRSDWLASRGNWPVGRGSSAVTQAQRAYDQQAAGLTPTAAEFNAWLGTLPVAAQEPARQAGCRVMWSVPLFRRFVLEARGQRIASFMDGRLSTTDFQRWVDATHQPQ